MITATFYNTSDDTNVIGKTLTDATEIDIRIKDKQSSFLSLIITLKYDEFPQFNYCYIAAWDRYYFISNIEVTPNNIYFMTLRCDVLESHKDELLQCSGYITQQTQNINPYYGDGYATELRREADLYKSTVTLSETRSMLLTTIGG